MSVTKPEPKPGDERDAFLVPTVGRIKGFAETYKPWKAPRLTEEGRLFEPKRHKAGDIVVFESGGKRMKGQVWSEGPVSGSLWVVIDQVAYLVRGAR